MKKTIFTAAAFLIAGLFIAGALEVLLRVLNFDGAGGVKGLYVPSNTVGFTMKPNFTDTWPIDWDGDGRKDYVMDVRINSKGFRDDEHTYEKPSGRRRILGIGDSFVFGCYVRYENTMLRKLEAQLPNIEVIKSGVANSGSARALLYLRNEGMRYSPDVIIYFLYVGNDIKDDMLGVDNIAVDSRGQLSYRASVDEFYGNRVWIMAKKLLRHSYLLRTVQNALGRFEHKGPAPLLPVSDETVFLKEYPDDFEEAFGKTCGNILAMKSLAKEAKARFVLVLLPHINQVEEREFEKTRRGYGLKAELFDLTKPQRLLTDFCRKNDIKCLDILPVFLNNKTQKLFSKDRHYTAAGYQIVVEALKGQIE